MLFTDSTCYIDGESMGMKGIQKICEWMNKHNKASYQLVLQENALQESMDKKLNAVMTSTKYLFQKTERHLMEINLRALDTEKLAEFAKEISEESDIYNDELNREAVKEFENEFLYSENK